MPKLVLTETGKKEEKVFSLTDKIRIGRLPESDIPLQHASVSRDHAEVFLEDLQYYLRDLGSGNGTLLNGLVVKSNEKMLLKNNDRLNIGNFTLRFIRTDEFFEQSMKEEEEVTDADILEIKLLKKVLDAVDQETVPSLEVLNGCAEGKRFFLSDDTEEMIIGRDPASDFPVNEDVISRSHAKIVKRWGGIALVDLESKNGSYVNNKRITEEYLHDGDRLALGTIVFLFRNPQEINIKEISEEILKKRPPLSPKFQPKPAQQKTEEEAAEEEGEATEQSPQETEDILEQIPTWKPAAGNTYPLPMPAPKHLTPLEIGMIGLGIVVLSFAIITLANLILE